MRVTDVLQEINIPKYSQALLCTESHKTCLNLAESLNQTHDILYQSFRSPIASKEEIRSHLIALAQKELTGDKTYLIFDDSQLSKPYAKDIEGLDVGFDGSSGRPELGIQMITALITDLQIKLPIDLIPYISKQIAGRLFKTKSDLAADIFLFLHKIFVFDLLIADAHYSTKFFLTFLSNVGQAFLMKFTCSRIVTIGTKTEQLRRVLRLRKNEHFRSAKGLFDGHSYYFYAIKVKYDTTCYFISLNEIQKNDLISLYKIRWNIELYHRTAKQYLGWKDCQMRAIEKQELHSFYVMYSYAIADLVRCKLKLSSTEDAIRELWRVKLKSPHYRRLASRENFCCVA